MVNDFQVQDAPEPIETRAGVVALIGLPNAGKSSLINAFLDQKLSIVTPFAQTTRQRVIGIDTHDHVQMIFVDTPGLVEPRYLLHRSMLDLALTTVPDADVILFLVDASSPPPKMRDEVVELLRTRSSALVVAANKIDVATPEQVRGALRWAEEMFNVDVATVSAKTCAGLAELRERISARLPESPFLYPADEASSQPVRFFVAELVRETVFELYQQEIPYSVAAQVEEFLENATPPRIRVTIYVERPSQKAILIGRGGEAIKSLGQQARTKIEQFLQTRVHLELWVKVLPRWRKDAVALRRFGFPVTITEE
jgi:GTP-binding protein Era